MALMTIADATRIVAAVGRRTGDADDFDLAELLQLREVVEDAIATAVGGLLAQGHSWAYVAGGLGVTRQAAHKRYANHPNVRAALDSSLDAWEDSEDVNP